MRRTGRLAVVALTALMGAVVVHAAGSETVAGKAKPATKPRPADLDLRIPWLAGLGMAQSGGPEPLVPTRTIQLPARADLESVCELEDLVACTTQQVNGPWMLSVFGSGGEARWSRTLPGQFRWIVRSDGGHLFAIPRNLFLRDSAQILVFNRDGRQTGAATWRGGAPSLAASTMKRRIRHFEVHDGIVIGRADDGSSMALSVAHSTTVSSGLEAHVTDLQLSGEGVAEEEHAQAYKDGWVIVGAKAERGWSGETADRKAAREARSRERLARVKPWIGKRFKAGDLPFFDPSLRERSKRKPSFERVHAWSSLGQMLALNADGSAWVEGTLFDPQRTTIGDMRQVKTRHPFDAPVVQANFVALFREDGRLRGYLVKQRPMTRFAFPAGCAIYIWLENGLLERWEPLTRNGS